MKSGIYYIGDLCYVTTKEEWKEICDKKPYNDGKDFTLSNGKTIAMYGTAYGDGQYDLETIGGSLVTNRILVDSGTVGCILVSDIDSSKNFTQPINYGAVVEIKTPFYVGYDDGVIEFGEYQVDTDPTLIEYEEEDDEY